jgi:hypothetical protein
MMAIAAAAEALVVVSKAYFQSTEEGVALATALFPLCKAVAPPFAAMLFILAPACGLFRAWRFERLRENRERQSRWDRKFLLVLAAILGLLCLLPAGILLLRKI